jgi:hypothetical protein
MKSLIRKDTSEGWRSYVVRPKRAQGVIEPDARPTDEGVRRFDNCRE